MLAIASALDRHLSDTGRTAKRSVIGDVLSGTGPPHSAGYQRFELHAATVIIARVANVIDPAIEDAAVCDYRTRISD